MRPFILAVLAIALAAPCAAAQQDLAPDSTVRTLLAERLPAAQGGGIVVGLLDPRGSRRIVAAGAEPNAVFEIGSITKVFTTAVLAVMAAGGSVSLDDPVAALLPDSVRVPARSGRQITLLDLATQSSGLPRLPSNLAPRDPSNPYADYAVEQLYAFLSGYTLTRDPGQAYEYSNLGMGLLGHALALKEGSSYEELVVRRVIAPLGMRETVIELPLAMRRRLAPGHDGEGRIVPLWDLPTLAGAGALRSTAANMLAFLAANVDTTVTPLVQALRETHRPRRAAGRPEMAVGLGWHILTRPGGSIVWHNGGTGGYRSFIGFDPARRAGVVVLTNSNATIDDIGFHLLDETIPLRPPPRPRTEVAVDSAILDRYVGEYELSPTFRIVVTREGAALFIQATAQPKFQVYAESETAFFLKVVDAQVTFERDAAGVVTRLVLHQNGQDMPGKKVR